MADGLPLKTLMACIAGDFPDGVNWEAVIAAANRTLTAATMAERIFRAGSQDRLPEDVLLFLTAVYGRAVERNARLSAQLAEAAVQLNRFGVRPLLLKGAAILYSAGEEGCRGRILSDLDLMVPASSLPAAIRSLEEIGYAPREPIPDKGLPAVLSRSQDAGTIDLHSRLKSGFPSLGFDELMPGATALEIGGGTAWLPSPAMQILILILHDQLQERDYWRGFMDVRHLLDMETLALSPRGVDWGQLAALFPAGYPQRALRTQLLTARELLGVPVPPELCSGWRARVQFHRRLAQAKWPWLRTPATILSLLLDPPLRRGKTRRMKREAPIAAIRTLSGLRRFARPRGIGKI